ncbi:MAG: hypothetical protein HZB13_07555, partial [Acidobacteria bacterium]|nr:hypothetical protein [Acidobacteriota bacterium]
RRSPHLTILTGLATFVFFVLATARWPIHYAALYWLLPAFPIVYALRHQYLPDFKFDYPRTPGDLAPLSVALFPLVCLWLIALKPEVSSDGLAMHMVIPARMAWAHAWNFDVQEFTWAVMPMGGDWAFSIAWLMGGEAAARLLNFAVLCLIAWIIFERLHARVPNWMTAALTGAFLSTPLTQHVTGSLFVENVVALWILGAALILRVYVKERRAVFLYAFAFFCGMAAASKFGALAFVVPLLLAACVQAKIRHLAIAVPLAAAVGSIPYVEAVLRTANPLFPFFNSYFNSPFYDKLTNFRDVRFETPIAWTTWYDITFHSSRFIEGQDGSLGFLFFILIPICLVGLRRRWPRTGFVLLWVGLAGSVISFMGQSNLRYLYSALPLFTLLIGVTIASFRLRSPRLGQALAGTAALAFLLNLVFLPAAGWYHKNFTFNRAFNPKAVANYLTASAPERKLVDWLNVNDPAARVAWMEGNAIADFHGRAFTNSWHSDQFYRRLRESTAPEGHGWLAQDLKIGYFIAPAPGSWRALTNVYTREFLDRFTRPVIASSDLELRRWSPPDPGITGPPPPHAPPGEYDEISAYTHFTGHWARDLQFHQAYRGTLVYGNDSRSRLLIRFNGTAVRLKYTAAANRCTALISIDEGEEFPFSQFSQETRWQALSPRFAAAAPGEHLLQLRFPQDRSKTAISSCYIDLDGFVVE